MWTTLSKKSKYIQCPKCKAWYNPKERSKCVCATLKSFGESRHTYNKKEYSYGNL